MNRQIMLKSRWAPPPLAGVLYLSWKSLAEYFGLDAVAGSVVSDAISLDRDSTAVSPFSPASIKSAQRSMECVYLRSWKCTEKTEEELKMMAGKIPDCNIGNGKDPEIKALGTPLECDHCHATIPATVALGFEGADYIYHFCGPQCLAAWREPTKNANA